MLIPDMTLRQRHIGAYGGGAMELTPGLEEPGCPWRYHMLYVRIMPRADTSWQLMYGTAIHDALYLMEEKALPMDEALREAWPPELDAARYEEALKDLRSVIERGGLLTVMHTIAVEQNLDAVLYEDEDFGPVRFGGRLDVIAVDSEVSLNETLYVADYKTNRTPPSYADLDRWMQGRSYAWLALQNLDRYMPEADDPKVVVVYDAVKYYALAKQWTVDELETWRAWAESVARKILRDDDPRPRLNPGCGFCEFKADCPSWKRLPELGEGLLERLSGVPLEKQAARLEKMKETRNRLTRGIEEVEALIIERIRVTDKPLEVGHTSWTYDQIEEVVVDARAVHAVIGDGMYPMVRLSKTQIEAYAKEHPDKGVALGRALARRPGGYRLRRHES